MIPDHIKKFVDDNPDPTATQPVLPTDTSMNAGGIERFAAAVGNMNGKKEKEPQPYEAIDPKTNKALGVFANTAMGDLANLQVSDYGQNGMGYVDQTGGQ